MDPLRTILLRDPHLYPILVDALDHSTIALERPSPNRDGLSYLQLLLIATTKA